MYLTNFRRRLILTEEKRKLVLNTISQKTLCIYKGAVTHDHERDYTSLSQDNNLNPKFIR